MELHIKDLYKRLNKMPFSVQGLIWFISFKLSSSILQGLDDVSTHLVTTSLQFFLTLAIVTIALAILEVILLLNT